MPPELLADSAFLKIKYLLTRGGGSPWPLPSCDNGVWAVRFFPSQQQGMTISSLVAETAW